MNRRQRHEQGMMYAEAYIARVHSIRWDVESREWSDLLEDVARFGRTVHYAAKNIIPRRDKKNLSLRFHLSRQLAEVMYQADFRQVFAFDRMLKSLSDQARG